VPNKSCEGGSGATSADSIGSIVTFEVPSRKIPCCPTEAPKSWVQIAGFRLGTVNR
jgi:hypothetical protein